MLRTILMCLVGLIIIGFLLFVVGYLGEGFIEPAFLAMIHKLGYVLLGVWVIYCLCVMIGWANPPSWPRNPPLA